MLYRSYIQSPRFQGNVALIRISLALEKVETGFVRIISKDVSLSNLRNATQSAFKLARDENLLSLASFASPPQKEAGGQCMCPVPWLCISWPQPGARPESPTSHIQGTPGEEEGTLAI